LHKKATSEELPELRKTKDAVERQAKDDDIEQQQVHEVLTDKEIKELEMKFDGMK
jgi:hypothetical protein